MAENKFKCSGDCLNCRLNPVERKTQWQYCSAQFTYNSMRMIEAMQESITAMQGKVNELAAKIEAIQNSEANVFDPTKDEEKLPKQILETSEESVTEEDIVNAIAQQGSGA